jgi:hypothetical protein
MAARKGKVRMVCPSVGVTTIDQQKHGLMVSLADRFRRLE